MCVEQIRQHNEVDVFTSVRILRRPRPRLMPNLVRPTTMHIHTKEMITRINAHVRLPFQTEYRYCYEVVLHYVLHCLRQLGKAKEVQQR